MRQKSFERLRAELDRNEEFWMSVWCGLRPSGSAF
jgi:hypothetical protein